MKCQIYSKTIPKTLAMDNFKQMCPLPQIPYHEIKLLNKLYEGNRSIVYESSYGQKNTLQNYIV